jgi:hypothetical protein
VEEPRLQHSSTLRILVKAILLSCAAYRPPLCTITTYHDGMSCQIAVNLKRRSGLPPIKVSPLLSYARVLLDKLSAELSLESVQEELSSASSVPGRLPVKAEKSIVPYFQCQCRRMPRSSALNVFLCWARRTYFIVFVHLLILRTSFVAVQELGKIVPVLLVVWRRCS